MKVKLLSLVVIVLFSMTFSVNAQNAPAFPADSILVCVAPEVSPLDSTPLAGSSEPYLMVFRNTPALGFLIPFNANVVIYSTYPTTNSDGDAINDVHAALYEVIPDAASGGYRPHAFLAHAKLNSSIPSDPHLCGSTYQNFPLSTLPASVSLPVSTNHAVLVQVGGSDLLLQSTVVESSTQAIEVASPSFLGVFAFQFNPGNVDSFRGRFQFIQLGGGSVEINLPFYTGQVNYLLVANKNVAVRRSYAEAPDEFCCLSFADDRSYFILGLSAYGNLFDLMVQDHIRIFPLQGIELSYTPGGYIRLEMSDGPALRDPQFAEGSVVRMLDGLERVNYYVSLDHYFEDDEDPYGALLSQGATACVVEIDQDGQLIVDHSNQQGIIDAWLVEVVPDAEPC